MVEEKGKFKLVFFLNEKPQKESVGKECSCSSKLTDNVLAWRTKALQKLILSTCPRASASG